MAGFNVHSATSRLVDGISALPPKADIKRHYWSKTSASVSSEKAK
jgi:hypothetical protein